MIKRILFAYLGTVPIFIVTLPIAMILTIGGHSLTYVAIFGSPIGQAVLLWILDRRRGFPVDGATIRSVVAFIIVVACIVVIGIIDISPFLATRGWMLIPLISPLPTEILSVMLSRIK